MKKFLLALVAGLVLATGASPALADPGAPYSDAGGAASTPGADWAPVPVVRNDGSRYTTPPVRRGAAPADAVQNAVPPGRDAGGGAVYNHSTMTFGVYEWWRPLTLTTFDSMLYPAYRSSDGRVILGSRGHVAGLYLGPKAGGWCWYTAPETGTDGGIYTTTVLASNTPYTWGYLGSAYSAWHVYITPRNGAATCPTLRWYWP